MIEYFKYTDKEMDQIMKSMVILIDTREKQCDHVLNYFDKAGISYIRRALDYGDYSFYIPQNEELAIPKDIYFDKKIIVERKGSLEELAGNLTKDRARLEKELSLAPIHKVMLIENANYSDVINGKYDSKYNNKSFWGSLHSFWFKYNIPSFFMPDISYSGFFIRGYFEYFLKNYLR